MSIILFDGGFMETYGWIGLRKNYDKVYFVPIKGKGVIEVPAMELFTKQGKPLLFKEPKESMKDCIFLKVVFEEGVYTKEDEEVVNGKDK